MKKHVNIKKLRSHRGWSQRSRELLDVRVCFVLRFALLKEESGCSVESGLEGARGDTKTPGGDCYNGSAEKIMQVWVMMWHQA